MLKKRASGIFFTDGKKTLLLKREKNSDNPGTWGLPGGKVERGETLLDAAKREAEEECGKIEGERFGDVAQNKGNYDWTTFFFKIKKPFECKISKEHTDWGWFDISDLENIKLHPKLKENLSDHIKIVNKYFDKKLEFKEWIYNL